MRFILIILIITSVSLSYLYTYENITYNAYFCQVEDCEEIMSQLINNTENPYCAFFDLNSEKIISILKKKDAPVIIDIQYQKRINEKWDNLIFVKRKSLMHNKFCILNDIIITGSLNPTRNGFDLNDNNIIIIKSPKISSLYLNYFNEIYNGKGFNIKGEKIKNIDICFSPGGKCLNTISKNILNSKKSIYFLTFSFSSLQIANDLILANLSGVHVEGIYETSQIRDYSTYNILLKYNITVMKDKNKRNMHHKIFIFDEKKIITGSFNPTNNAAERNDENLLVIEDEKLAKEFLNEYYRIKNQILKQ